MNTYDTNSHAMEMESGEPTGENATVEIGGREIDLHIPKLEDIDHPFVPEVDQNYIAREINGTMDLELLSYVIEDPDYFAMLEGEAATGKNFSVLNVAASANWPVLRNNLSISSSYQSLVGRFAPKEGADGKSVDKILDKLAEADTAGQRKEIVEEYDLENDSNFHWVDGLLTRAVKYGWIFVADEINAADNDAIMPLNGLTEDRDSRYLTIEEKAEIIEPHPRFRFVATRNPVTYAGVSDMNSALESRGYIVPFDYHEPAALREILRNRTDIVENTSANALESLVEMVQDIREQEQGGTQLVTKVSTRDLIKIGRLTDIMSIRNACKTVLMGIADPTDENSIREIIETTRF